MNTAPAYRALGTSDSELCTCCGRTDLKRAILVAPVDADDTVVGEAVPYGSVCAARATGRPARDLVNEAASADTRAAAERREVREYIERMTAEGARPARIARLALTRAHRAGEGHWITPLLRAEAEALVGAERAADIAADIAAF